MTTPNQPKFAGRPPLGWNADGSPNVSEQRALRAIRTLLERGVSLRKIGGMLLSLGHHPRGRTWNLTTIARTARRLRALHAEPTTPT